MASMAEASTGARAVGAEPAIPAADPPDTWLKGERGGPPVHNAINKGLVTVVRF